MHGKPDGTKARKDSGTKVFNEQSIFLKPEWAQWWYCLMKKASQDYNNRYSQVGWQFCLEESINFSDPAGMLKNNGKW